jgi:TPP-dependent pyruvate/acetoin dehydrogenase alpha subunit
LEISDEILSDAASTPCPGYKSQAVFVAQALSLVSVLDHDDYIFLSREFSLAALHRGVSIEQYVGQWRGNILDPGKGRLPPGAIVSEASHIVPSFSLGSDRIRIAIGVALAMRARGHSKLVLIPLGIEELSSADTLELLGALALNPLPVVLAVSDGEVKDLAQAVGIRYVDATAPEILDSMKLEKNALDRSRSRGEGLILRLPEATMGAKSFSRTVGAILEKRGYAQDAKLEEQLRAEVEYGISRARSMPAPPRNTVIQDVRAKVEPGLERDWKEWRKAHGK